MPKTKAEKNREYWRRKNAHKIKKIPKSSTERVREFRARQKKSSHVQYENNSSNVNDNVPGVPNRGKEMDDVGMSVNTMREVKIEFTSDQNVTCNFISNTNEQVIKKEGGIEIDVVGMSMNTMREVKTEFSSDENATCNFISNTNKQVIKKEGGIEIDVVGMSVNTMREVKTEFSSDLNVTCNFISNTDEQVIKREEVEVTDTTLTMPIQNWHPLVLTTRLDDMCVLQKRWVYSKSKNIIRKIYLESKAASLAENTPDFKYICRCAKKIKKKHKIKFQKLREKLERMRLEIKIGSTHNNMNEIKKRSFTLVDFSSDEDDSLLTYRVKRNKVENSNSILRNYLNQIDETLNTNPTRETEHYETFVKNLRKIVDLKIINKMTQIDSNTVIVVNNVYSQTSDIYVTDVNNRIFEYMTVPLGHYSIFDKLLVSYNIKLSVNLLYSLLWINCCCWVQRQNEIKKKCLKDIAHFLFSSHTCLKCSCCCNKTKSELTVCETGVYSSKELSDPIKDKEICNPLIKMALNFKKPNSKGILNTELSIQHKDKSTSSMQFMFKTVCKKDKRLDGKISGSKDYIKTEAFSNNQFEFVQLGFKRDLVCHSFNIPAKVVSTLESVRKVKDLSLDVCCEVRFKCLIRLLCVEYDIRPTVFKYIEGIHKCNIYHTYINNRPEKCTQCKDIKIYDDKRGVVSYDLKVVLAPIEHTRKIIKGRIVRPKTEILAHSKDIIEKAKTIQEMMEKVKTKFPNMSYFINDQGLPTASLPKPFHLYPAEDIKQLTEVLEFAQSKIINQKRLSGGTEVKLKQVNSNVIMSAEVKKKLELQTANSDTQTNSKQLVECNLTSKPPTDQNKKRLDLYTLLIKRNKQLYIESFKSFVNTSIDPNRVKLQVERNLPKIVDVCSLAEYKEIAKKTRDATPDEIT